MRCLAEKERVSFSALIRYAALTIAKHVLTPPVPAVVVPDPSAPEPERPSGFRHAATYASFADYRANSPYANRRT